MRRVAILLCAFSVCFGPFPTAGEATSFIFSQSSWVNQYSNVVQDGDGFDAIVKLKGRGNDNNCVAGVFGTPPPVCAGMTVGGRIEVENGMVIKY